MSDRPERDSSSDNSTNEAPPAAQPDPASGGFLEDESEEGLSLEELSQTYADMLGTTSGADQATELGVFTPEDEDSGDEQLCPVTPESILEAVLFVGRPDQEPLSAEELAGLMRGVSVEEIGQLVAELNANYERSQRAIRVHEEPAGFRMGLAPDMEFMRERFYGQVKAIRLNQAAVDCLALIAYQPGISRQDLEKQRSMPSGAVLSQLVRRQLVEMRREGEGKQATQHYYPTTKLTELAGLESLSDLPQVEEFD